MAPKLLVVALTCLTFPCSPVCAESGLALPQAADRPSLASSRYNLKSFLDVAVYVGTGYDLLRGSPDGASLTTGGSDPGLKVAKPILHQTKQPEGCIAEANCVHFETSFTDQLYSTDSDIRSYQESHDSSWNIEGEVGVWIFKARGRASKTSNELMSEFQKYESIILNVRNLTNYGDISYRYHEEKRLSNNFIAAVCELPNTYEEGPYQSFIREWGTHVVTSATMGKRVTSRKIFTKSEFTKTIMQNFTSSISGSLNLGVFASASMSSNLNSRMIDTIMTASENSYTSHLVVGSEERPAPITYSLRKLDHFVDMDYLKASAQFIGSCSLLDNNRNTTIRVKENVAKAIEDYPKLYNISADDLPQVNRSIEPNWPDGEYSLLVPNSTMCPEGWAGGIRNVTFQVLRHHSKNEAPGGYLENPYGLDGLLFPTGYGPAIWMVNFCTKRTEREIEGSAAHWQRGAYCIFQKGGTCPNSFPGAGNMTVSFSVDVTGTGSTMFSHKTVGNLPDGGFGYSYTILKYCCRDDGPINRPLYLPSDTPFMLLPIGKVCQQVVGMDARLKSLTTIPGRNSLSLPGFAYKITSTSVGYMSGSLPTSYFEISNSVAQDLLEHTIYICEYVTKSL